MSIPSEIKDRIIATADELYEQSGRESMPTVDAVRRAAKVDMNSASAVMREWRKRLTAQAAPVAVAIPEPVAKAASVATAALWKAAQDVAGEALQAAAAAWETERVEMEQMRQEMSQAFELQAEESASEIEELTEQIRSGQEALQAQLDRRYDAEKALETERAEHQQTRSDLAVAAERSTHLLDQVEGQKAQVVALQAAAEAQAKKVEALSRDLSASQQTAAEQAGSLKSLKEQLEESRSERTAAVAQLDELRTALATATASLKAVTDQVERQATELASARAEAQQAVTQAAELRGQLAAIEKAQAADKNRTADKRDG